MKEIGVNEEIFIAGIAIRTSFEGDRAPKDLGQLWQRFFTEKVMEKITHRVSDCIYGIYTDYQNSDSGEYTALVGVQVRPGTPVLSEFQTCTIPSGRYLRFGPPGREPHDIAETWQNIRFRSQSEFKRAFRVDFDKYDGENIEIFVGCL